MKYHSSGVFQILDSLSHKTFTVDLADFESMLIKLADDRQPGKAASILKDRTSNQCLPTEKENGLRKSQRTRVKASANYPTQEG